MNLLYWGIVVICLGGIVLGTQMFFNSTYQSMTALGVVLVFIGGIIAVVPRLLLKHKLVEVPYKINKNNKKYI